MTVMDIFDFQRGIYLYGNMIISDTKFYFGYRGQGVKITNSFILVDSSAHVCLEAKNPMFSAAIFLAFFL